MLMLAFMPHNIKMLGGNLITSERFKSSLLSTEGQSGNLVCLFAQIQRGNVYDGNFKWHREFSKAEKVLNIIKTLYL